MNNEQREAVLVLRSQGQTYQRIAEVLDVSINTVKSFCRRGEAKKDPCKQCGKPLVNVLKHKPKIFCSDYCRQAWWKTNRDQMNQKAVYSFDCAHCQSMFESYGKKDRKYCSHACYIAERYGSVP